MPRGIPKNKAMEMSEQELNEIEQETIAPVVGNLNKRPVNFDKDTMKAFARVEKDVSSWSKMTDDEAVQLQEYGLLVGHDTNKGVGLLVTVQSIKTLLDNQKIDYKEYKKRLEKLNSFLGKTEEVK